MRFFQTRFDHMTGAALDLTRFHASLMIENPHVESPDHNITIFGWGTAGRGSWEGGVGASWIGRHTQDRPE